METKNESLTIVIAQCRTRKAADKIAAKIKGRFVIHQPETERTNERFLVAYTK